MTVEYRPVEVRDIPLVVDIMAAMHAESTVYRKFDFDRDEVAEILEAVLGAGTTQRVFRQAAFVHGPGEQVTIGGMILAEVVDDVWTSARITSDHGVYVRPEHRGGRMAMILMDQYITWARQNADIVRVAVVAGINDEQAGKFMEHAGLQRRGAFYGMEI